MTRWIVFVMALFGLGLALLVGRRAAMRKQFVWRRVIIVWALLVLTISTALLPIGVNTMANNPSNLDILFVVDLTPSINAADGRGGNETTRLQNIRDDMHTIANQNAGASLGIMTFADQFSAYLPLTTGTSDVTNAIDTLYTADQYQTVQKVMPYTKVFEQVGDYLAKQQAIDPTRQRVVVFMSDFEIYKDQDQIDQVVKSAGSITAHGASYAGLLYGQEAGAKIINMRYDYETGTHAPSYLKYGDEEYTKYLQNKYKTITSVPNIELATKISESMGTKLIRTSSSQDFQSVIQSASSKSGRSAAKSSQYQALHQNILYVVPAAMLFAWLCIAEFVMPRWLKLVMPRTTKASKTSGGQS